MNKRKLKNFFKKGGHYHYDKTIKRIAHKKLLHPLVTDTVCFTHAVVWIPIGQCPTCSHCTDMYIDWDGTPYMCFSKYGICGRHHGDYGCKRYKLDPDLKFFKIAEVHPDSPDSELKRYIDKQIEDKHEQSTSTNMPMCDIKAKDVEEASQEYEKLTCEFFSKFCDEAMKCTPVPVDMLQSVQDEEEIFKYIDGIKPPTKNKKE
jgi:hypothetical protein